MVLLSAEDRDMLEAELKERISNAVYLAACGICEEKNIDEDELPFPGDFERDGIGYLTEMTAVAIEWLESGGGFFQPE